MTDPLGPEPLEDGGCRWLATYEHSRLSFSERKPEAQLVTCCGCKTRVDYTTAFVTTPFGKHGNRLPLPVFVHCLSCSLTLDARGAWMQAYEKDKAAALPDPERVRRERELNRRLNPFLKETE